ncbi:DMT family transporter [Sulfobacillus harzensis]|uniref:DMT family transporter n=1 Tax=Sulfobacillus harzensis TaxID=2729629 RepID=A0A7Y0Q1A3_9FIRM|nr:DMT family transporter [Sulfobacillus harzensis]NMP21888.1 DMT family transporter [Sulfobacillus harzensis]
MAWLVLATLLWGGNYIAGRVLAFQISPLVLNAVRWILSSLILIGILKVTRRRFPWHEWKALLWMGLLGMFVFSALTYLSLGHVGAAEAGLISGTMPVIIMILSVLLLKQRVTWLQWGGALVSVVGVAVLVGGGATGHLMVSRGVGELLAAAVAWSLYTVYGKKFSRRIDAITLTTGAAAVGAMMSSLTALALWHTESVHLAAVGIVSLFYVSTAASVIAYLLWTAGVARVGAAAAGPFMNLLPIWTVVLGLLLLHESLSLGDLIGGVFIIIGAFLAGRPSTMSPATRDSDKAVAVNPMRGSDGALSEGMGAIRESAATTQYESRRRPA